MSTLHLGHIFAPLPKKYSVFVQDICHENARYFRVLCGRICVGYVGYVSLSENLFALQIFMLPSYRGCGYASLAIGLLLRAYPHAQFVATIDKSNTASCRAVEKCQFSPIEKWHSHHLHAVQKLKKNQIRYIHATVSF